MDWTDTALVLRVGRFRESDLWVRLLTRQRGLVSAFAFGASRSRRRFPGCLDLLNVIRVRARDTRGGAYLNLEEGTLLSGPRRLRQDWRRLGMIMNCVRFLEALGVGPENADSAFTLTRALFGLGEEAADLCPGLPVLYRLRLASDQGYAPDFSVCGSCGALIAGASRPGRFRMREGLLLCADCYGADCYGADCYGRAGNGGTGLAGNLPGNLPGDLPGDLSGDLLAALRAVQRALPGDWNALALSPEDWRACVRFADAFVQFHLGLSWEKGRFRRQ
jgi:DNA repair protein RecO (recombination protein O)